MDQLIDEVRSFASAAGVSPATVVQRAGCGNGSTWAKWISGVGSPTLRIVDRLRAYMANASEQASDAGASEHDEGAA